MSNSEITPAFFNARPSLVVSNSSKKSPTKFPAMDVNYLAERDYQMKMGVIPKPQGNSRLTEYQLLWRNIANAPLVPPSTSLKSNISLTPVCTGIQSCSTPPTVRLETPKRKRLSDSPVEGTPSARIPRFISPVISLQQELLEVFAKVKY